MLEVYQKMLKNETNSSYKGGKKEDWRGDGDDDEDEEGGYHKTVNCASQ